MIQTAKVWKELAIPALEDDTNSQSLKRVSYPIPWRWYKQPKCEKSTVWEIPNLKASVTKYCICKKFSLNLVAHIKNNFHSKLSWTNNTNVTNTNYLLRVIFLDPVSSLWGTPGVIFLDPVSSLWGTPGVIFLDPVSSLWGTPEEILLDPVSSLRGTLEGIFLGPVSSLWGTPGVEHPSHILLSMCSSEVVEVLHQTAKY